MLRGLWVEIGRIRVRRFWGASAFVGFGGRGGESVFELHHGSIHRRWSRLFPQSSPFTSWSTRWETCEPTSICWSASKGCNGCD
jgi:hypothetical protein